ncbi:hypothetical protein ACOMHN_012518 [Nucella lapillus]
MNMSGGMSGMSGMPGMGMMMYFHTGFNEYILFKKTYTETQGAFAAACVVVVVWAWLYEGLKFLREELYRRQRSQVAVVMMHGTPQDKTLLHSPVKQMFCKLHLLQTGLHIVQIFMSYCLMLVFMTFNVYLAVSVLIGSAIGYFTVAWKRPFNTADQNEHCH